MRTGLLISLVVAFSCSSSDDSKPGARAAAVGDQRETDAWKAACEVTRAHADELAQVAPAERQARISGWIAEVLTNPTARDAFARLGAQSPAERQATLKTELTRNGISSCHLADVLAHDDAVAACERHGDAAACGAAAERFEANQLYPGRQADAVRFRQAGCLHGDASQCVAAAASSPDAEPWKARACRRGHSASCGEGAAFADVILDVTPDGPASQRIETAYRGSVADCLAATRKSGTGAGELRFELRFEIEQNRVTVAGDLLDGTRDCLQGVIIDWRFVEPPREALAIAARWAGQSGAASKVAELEATMDAEIAREITLMLGETTEIGTVLDGRMDDTAPGGDLDKVIAEVRESGSRIARVAPGEDLPSGVGSTRGPRVSGPGDEPPAARLQARVAVGTVSESDPSSLGAGAVKTKIRRAYARGLKRCFEKVLRIDETAAGTVKLKFEVGETGRVTRAKVLTGFGFPTLDRCIADQSRAWRFAVPKDADDEPAAVSYTVSLAMSAK